MKKRPWSRPSNCWLSRMLPEFLKRKPLTAWTSPALSGHERVRTYSRPGCGRGDMCGLRRCVLHNKVSDTQHGRAGGPPGQERKGHWVPCEIVIRQPLDVCLDIRQGVPPQAIECTMRNEFRLKGL